MEYKHIPVMLNEVMEYLNPRPGGYFIDCTLGGGGYAMELARKAGEKGKVLAIDLDEAAIKNFKFKILNFKLNNVILVQDNFRNLAEMVKNNFGDKDIKFDGVVFDLGLSSAQLDDRKRGFSFQFDTPLDMAFRRQTADDRQQATEYLVNNLAQNELSKILKDYGEERFAKNIAKKIIEARKIKPIKTTGGLVKIIETAVPASNKRYKIHFATRTFQALRIATNQELENLEKALPQAVGLLKSGGRLVILSYHSLEDIIVKNFLKREAKDCLCPSEFPVCNCGHKATLKILIKKVVKPSEDEVKINPRARSAKLRVAAKK